VDVWVTLTIGVPLVNPPSEILGMAVFLAAGSGAGEPVVAAAAGAVAAGGAMLELLELLIRVPLDAERLVKFNLPMAGLLGVVLVGVTTTGGASDNDDDDEEDEAEGDKELSDPSVSDGIVGETALGNSASIGGTTVLVLVCTVGKVKTPLDGFLAESKSSGDEVEKKLWLLPARFFEIESLELCLALIIESAGSAAGGTGCGRGKDLNASSIISPVQPNH